MKTKLLTLIIVVFTTLSFSQTTFTVDGLNYEVISVSPNQVKITGGTPSTTDLVIPTSVSDGVLLYRVTVIGEQAFGFDEDTRRNVPTITSVVIPNTVREIENFAFNGNQISGDLIIPNSVTTLGLDVFYQNQITSVTLSNSLTEIPRGTFSGNNISELILPNGITSIGEFAFSRNELTSITLPNTLSTIDAFAFSDNQLATFTLPSGLASIGLLAFRDNTITEVTALGNSAPTLTITSTGISPFEDVSDATLNIPANTLSSYVDNGWSIFGTIVAGDVTFESEFTVNGIKYLITSLTNNEVAVTGQDGTLTTINIPTTVANEGTTYSIVSVGMSAFRDNNLASVTIPNGVRSIERNAFLNNNLTTLVLPNSVTSLGDFCFQDNNIAQLTLSTNVTQIPSGAFRNNQLSSFTVTSNITSIGTSAFNNNQITSLVIPNTLVTLGSSAFRDNNISSLTLPNNLTTIPSFIFQGNNLTSVTIPNSVTSINRNAFRGNQLETLVIPENVTNIETEAFQNNQIGNLIIPDNLTSLGFSVFENNALTNLSIGSGLAEVSFEAFRNNQLTTVTIPSTVTRIRSSAFKDNPLTTVISEASTPPQIATGGNFDSFSNRQNIDLTVPPNTEDAYETATWTGFNTINGILQLEVGNIFEVNGLSYQITALEPNEVEVIGGTTIPTNLVLTETVTFESENFTLVQIGFSAFKEKDLISLELPNTIRIIRNFAFENNQLTALTIPSSVTRIDFRAFRLNEIEGSVTIPNSVTGLGNGVFEGNNISEITISENITAIDQQTFRSNQLTSVTIPANVNSLGRNCFRDNPLTEVIVLNTTPPSILSGNNDAFQNNRPNIALTVPETTELDYLLNGWAGFSSINGEDASFFTEFEVDNISFRITSFSPNEVDIIGGTNVPQNLVLPSNVTFQEELFEAKRIVNNAFRNQGITSVIIPNSVTSIGSEAFLNNEISTLVLSENLTDLGNASFQQNELTTVTLPASITNLGSKVFRQNPLKTVIAEGALPANVITGGSNNDSFGLNRDIIDLFIPTGTSQAYNDANWTGFNSTTQANKVLKLKVFLQGAFINPNAGEENLMREDLRVADLLPTTSPYADAAIADAIVFDTEGENAIVDWIFIELRDAANNTTIIESASALLQRDGDIVGTDGVNLFEFTATPDNYFIAIKHRNHLGIMVENATRLSSIATVLDFSKANSPITLGNNSQTDIGMPANTLGLWAGDSNTDGTVRFSGTNAEPTAVRDGVLNATGNPFGSLLFTLNGYLNQDVNMDGQVRFSGGNSEPLFVRDNVLGNPGNPFGSLLFGITSQLPQSPN